MELSDQKRAFLAVILSGIVLLLWQTYFAPPPATLSETAVPTSGQTSPSRTGTPSQAGGQNPVPETAGKIETPATSQIEVIHGEHSFTLGSNLSVQRAYNPNQADNFEQITGANPLKIQVLQGARAIDLNFEGLQTSSDGRSFEGVHSGLGITLKGYLDDQGRLQVSLTSPQAYLYRLSYNTRPDDLGNNRIRQYLVHTKEVERFNVGSEELADGQVNFVGIDHYYHLFAFAFKERLVARYRSFANGNMWVDFVNPTQNLEGLLVYTKKNYDHLTTLGNNFELSVDFGFFAILAIPILRGLQFFYEYFPNYGLAIIFLTLIIRLITFPLQFKSFKSMKKMQVIQPELQKLKEKYKDNPQRMQKETVELFRKAGANPLGGCFPLLLQMPVFFAFYQVLSSAVELVRAPFCLWIYDLSEKDPYYVLPVLMGLAMLGQTKLNPSAATIDSTQQKIMMVMPVVFAFIMKDFPAGLNLYIFVSTLFGIVQQLVVYKAID